MNALKGSTILMANSIATVEPSSWSLVSTTRKCNVKGGCFKDKSSMTSQLKANELLWQMAILTLLSMICLKTPVLIFFGRVILQLEVNLNLLWGSCSILNTSLDLIIFQLKASLDMLVLGSCSIPNTSLGTFKSLLDLLQVLSSSVYIFCCQHKV